MCGNHRLNTAAGFALYLVGAFALVIIAMETPSIQYYTGGIVIGLFIFGLFFAYVNAMRQTRRLVEKRPEEEEKKEEQPPKQA